MSDELKLEGDTPIVDRIRARQPRKQDVPFIYSSWLKSFRNSPLTRPMSNEIYYEEQHSLITDIMETSTTIIISDSEDPDHILGYICASRNDGVLTVHYVYVKHTYRRMGLGKLMLNAFECSPKDDIFYTHSVGPSKLLAAKFNLTYNPYILVANACKAAINALSEE
jgi:hypothetical protein